MNPGMETLFHDAVIPGSGWPGDPASETTPVTPLAGSVSELANSSPDLQELSARVSVCRACPRLVAWREEVAQTKRKAYANETYWGRPDRKSTRLNSSHVSISYAVFCLKKKNNRSQI